MDVLLFILDCVVSGMASLLNVDLPHSQGTLYRPGVFSPKLSFTGCRKLGIFLRGRPTDLIFCLDSILLM
jgi:hypothetical protein